MNDNFVAIKVDREERPDIDQIYMDACQLTTGRGGWPLNAIALPDGRPIFAGTYFPKANWIKQLQTYLDYYQSNREDALQRAAQITAGVQGNEMVGLNPTKPNFVIKDLEDVYEIWEKKIDFKLGGGKSAPKFPMPNNWEYLLRYAQISQNESVLKGVFATLDNMMMGGIYDQIGGGFARYSTDARWIVPHFEKTLYDNSQLVSLYSFAYQLTKKEEYKEVVFETLEYIEREMTLPQGGFYSSLDADSEGEEGKFYVWSKKEIIEVLGEGADTELFLDYYNLTAGGNFEGHNILLRKESDEQFAKNHQIEIQELKAKINGLDAKLMQVRDGRIRPGLDDKVLTSWNALMLKGYVDAYRVFGENQYLKAALKCADFILKNCMQKDHRLNRNFKNGSSSINAFLDDYALTIEAFIALYQATFDEAWLHKARDLANYAIAHFFDDNSKMFFYTSDLDDPLIARKMEVTDNVIPSSNSSMAKGLYYLGLYFYDNDFLSKAEQMLINVKAHISQYPNFYSNWAILMSHFVKELYEVAIVGPNAQGIRQQMDEHYLPGVLYLGGENEGSLELLKMKLQKGQTTIYVCQNKVCQLPVTRVEDAIEQLKIE